MRGQPGRWGRTWWAPLALVLAVASARADPSPTVAALVLPTRRADRAQLVERAASMATLLALRVGGNTLRLGPPISLGAGVDDAARLAAEARLDAAADRYDAELAPALANPYRVEDPPRFVRAVLARASIALARGEVTQAARLFERLLRFDPTLTLDASERTPRMSAAFDAAFVRMRGVPRLGPEDLGDACEKATTLLVLRPIPSGVEMSRFEGCRPVSTVILPDVDDDRAVAALFPQPSPLGARPAQGPSKKPLYKKAWFWGVLGSAVVVVAVGAGLTGWALTRRDEVVVTPRLTP